MSDGTTRALPPVTGPAVGVRVVVREGPDTGLSIALAGPILVGTSEACDLRLTDATVSRRHVALEPAPLGARVRDDDSRNGTFVEAMSIRDVEVPPGTVIRIGTTLLIVELAARAGAGAVSAAPRVEASPPREGLGRFLGSAPVLRDLYVRLEKAAASDATVLLEGESGTGKELLAEALHELGARVSKPFVIVDCGAVPENLIESELFGHERGAFTGAERAHEGAFERADGGTIFLDEIGELALSLQTRLLRVLDRRQVKRLGGQQPIDVDVRVIAATNRNLDREVEESRFRLDLFHRIAVVLVRVPPLREREGDVELLARHFVRSWGASESLLTDEALDRLRRHRWPGNVRELRNWIERLVLLGDASTGTATAPAPAVGWTEVAKSGLAYRHARALAIESFTDAYVADMLARHDGNVSKAARAAGIARRHFQRLKR